MLGAHLIVMMTTTMLTMYVEDAQGQRIAPNMWRTYGHMVNMNRLMKKYERTAFCALLHQTNLQQILFMDGFTIFAPADKAVLDFYRKHKYSYRKKRNYVKSHIYKGHLKLDNIHDGKSLTNLNGDQTYTNKMYDTEERIIKVWIQGAKVNKYDVEYGGNVLHLIDSSIEVSKIATIEYLRDSGNHNIVYKMLRRNRIYFKFPFGTTLLAPLDHAFTFLPHHYRKELHTNQYKARMFLRSHVVTRPMCHERMFNRIGWSRVYNNLGRSFSLFRDKHNKERCFANTGQVLVTTAVRDGWVYGITKAILPDITDPILQTVERIQCNKFLYYLINTGHFFKLISLLNDNTVFAPTDEAFDKLSSSTTKRLESDPKYLVSMVMYHIADRRYLSDSFRRTNEIVASRRNGMLMRKRRLFVSSTGNGTVQHATIIKPDILALNGIVHLIDEVLLPPNQTIYSYIWTRKRFVMFRRVLEKINSPLIGILKDRRLAITLIAPSNRAMRRLFRRLNTTEKVSRYSKDVTRQFTYYLSRHILVKPFFFTARNEFNDSLLETNLLCYGDLIGVDTKFSNNRGVTSNGIFDDFRKMEQTIPPSDQDLCNWKYGASNVTNRVRRTLNNINHINTKKDYNNVINNNNENYNNNYSENENTANNENSNTLNGNSNEVEHEVARENESSEDDSIEELNSSVRSNFSTQINLQENPDEVIDGSICNETRPYIPNNRKMLQPQKCRTSPLSFIRVSEFKEHLSRRNIPALNGVVHVVNRVLCLTDCPPAQLQAERKGMAAHTRNRKKSRRKRKKKKKKKTKKRRRRQRKKSLREIAIS